MTAFVELLRERLSAAYGKRNPERVWWDRSNIDEEAPLTQQISEKVQKSACLVVILSRGYVVSKWCRTELEAFLESPEDQPDLQSRIFLVDIGNLPEADRPEEFRDKLGRKFWRQPRSSDSPEHRRTLGAPVPKEGHPDYYDFYDEVEVLARDVASRVNKLSSVFAKKTPEYNALETHAQVYALHAKLPGISNDPAGPSESWQQSLAARSVAFENTIPAYMLDKNFFILDWNSAFDELFAKPLKLRRRMNHAGDFVVELMNPVAVLQRAAIVFAQDPKPSLDIESLQLLSRRYGRIDFRKVATQVLDGNAHLAAWAVYLNIESCEKPELLWGDLQRRLESELHWSRYAVSYDKLLLNFPEYTRLLESVVARVSGSRRILDLGAGTGNATLRLLQSDDGIEVCSVESNQEMAQQLVSKIEVGENSSSKSYFSRLQLMKESILQLDEFPKILRPGSYDAALMINVLYAVDEPQKCMEKVAMLLRPGGKVVISTPHQQTNVDHLFDVLRKSLESQGLFESLCSNFDDARQWHHEMMPKIHRDTKADIRSYIETAGFRITEWQDSVYADAVVVVEAEKL